MEDPLSTQSFHRKLNLLKQSLCKNAEIIVDTDKVELSVEVCKNAKRNGSAYCQQCSDIFKGKKVIIV